MIINFTKKVRILTGMILTLLIVIGGGVYVCLLYTSYEAAVELGKKMEELNVVIYAKAGDGGRLFGSITSKDIAEQIKKQHNIEVDKRKITLDEPIRVLGSRFVDIKIHQKVTTRLRVDVKEKQ